jgi:hypothetical protein
LITDPAAPPVRAPIVLGRLQSMAAQSINQ